MSNDFGSTYIAPGPVQVGLEVLAYDAVPLCDALNKLYAEPVRAIAQGWGPDIYDVKDKNITGATPSAHWRIPSWRDVTAADMTFYVHATGAATVACEVRFVSGASLVDIAIPAGATGWYTGTLAGVLSAGYLTDVEMYVEGGNAVGEHVFIHEVYSEWDALTSPLAAGVLDGGFVGLDHAEVASGYPVGADMVQVARADLIALGSRYRCYYTWSGLLGVFDDTLAPETMTPWPHRCVVPRFKAGDLDIPGLPLQVHVEAEFPGDFRGTCTTAGLGERGDDDAIWVGSTVLLGSWYHVHIPGEGRDGVEWVQVEAYPAGLDADSTPAPRGWRATAAIRSLTVWGY